MSRSGLSTSLFALLFLVVPLPSRGEAAPPEEGAHLRYRASYTAALAEGRIRNVPVLVSRHKDECGRCKRMAKRVFENKPFIRWANQHVIVAIGHNERLHDTLERTDPETGEVERCCPLYPGVSCREHVGIAVEMDVGRGEGVVQVPFLELCPNTWLIAPTGKVERVPEKAQFDPKAVRGAIETMQKALGEPLPERLVTPLGAALSRAEAAGYDEAWAEALEALAEIEAAVPEPHAALRGLVDARLEALEEDVGIAAEDVFEAEAVTEEERALAYALHAATQRAIYGKRLAMHDRLATWLADHGDP